MLTRLVPNSFPFNLIMGLLCFFVFILALYLSVFRLYFERIESIGVNLEKLFLENGFSIAKIGYVHTGWEGYDPKLTIDDLEIGTESGLSIKVEKLDLRISSFATLQEGNVVFSEIVAEDLKAYLDVDFDQKNFTYDREERERQKSHLFRVLDNLDYLEMNNVNIEIIRSEDSWKISTRANESWFLSEKKDKRHFSFPVMFERKYQGKNFGKETISLKGFYTGNFEDSSAVISGYSDINDFEIEGYADLISEISVLPISGILDSKVWFVWKSSRVNFSFDFGVESFLLSNFSSFDQISGELHYIGSDLSNGLFKLVHLNFEGLKDNFSLEDLEILTRDRKGSRVASVFLRSIDFEELRKGLDLIHQFKPFSGKLLEILDSIEVNGSLEDIFFLPGVGYSSPSLVANIVDADIKSFKGFPEIVGLNGFVSLAPNNGYLDFYNKEFSIEFKNVFSNAWGFSGGRGRIAYSIEDKNLSVRSGLLELLEGDTRAQGKVSLNINSDNSKNTWGLSLGVRNAKLEESLKYIPQSVGDGFRGWLKNASVYGKGNQIGVTVHGAFGKKLSSVGKSHDVFLDINETSLKFHNEWPRLRSAEGILHANSYFVNMRNGLARAYETSFKDLSFNIPVEAPNRVERILVTAKSVGPFADGIRFLNETPLSSYTKKVGTHWIGVGEIKSRIDLVLPLIDSNSRVQINTEVFLKDNLLQMKNLGVSFSDLKGVLIYNDEIGFSMKNLEAKFLGEPISGSARTVNYQDSRFVLFQAEGTINAVDLYKWSEQPLLYGALGTFNYDLNLRVPFLSGENEDVQLKIFSDLRGFRSSLPHPLDKKNADFEVPFSYQQTFTNSGYILQTGFGKRVHANLEFENNTVVGGQVFLGQDPGKLLSHLPLEIAGRLSYFNVDEWVSFATKMSKTENGIKNLGFGDNFGSFKISADQFIAIGNSFPRTNLEIYKEDVLWSGDFENQRLKGQVRIWEDNSNPLDIFLERLIIDPSNSQDSFFGSKDIGPISNYNLAGDLMVIGNVELRDVFFEYRQDPSITQLNNLRARLRSIQILESTLSWQIKDEEYETNFRGRFKIGDITDLKETFDFISVVERGQLDATADFYWKGLPFDLEPERVEGGIVFNSGSGRFIQEQDQPFLSFLGSFHVPSLLRKFIGRGESDSNQEGFDFRDIEGAITIEENKLVIRDPLVVRGAEGKFKFGGFVDWKNEIIDSDLIVTLPVGNTFPWAGLVIGGPISMAGVLATQKLFLEDRFDQFSSAKYKITGPIEDPDFEFVSIFNDDVRRTGNQNTPP